MHWVIFGKAAHITLAVILSGTVSAHYGKVELKASPLYVHGRNTGLFIQVNMSIPHHFPTSLFEDQQIDSWIAFMISNDCCSTRNPQLWQHLSTSPFVTSHEKNRSDLILNSTAASINTSKLLHLGILCNLTHLTEERTCNLPIMLKCTPNCSVFQRILYLIRSNCVFLKNHPSRIHVSFVNNILNLPP